jgi:phage terminase small subunit
MGGRPRKPAALRRLIGREGQVVAGSELPAGCDRPDYLSGTAAQIWEEVAPWATQVGLLDQLNGHLLAAFCLLAGKVRDNPDKLRQGDLTEIRALANMFRLSPAARAKLGLPMQPRRV